MPRTRVLALLVVVTALVVSVLAVRAQRTATRVGTYRCAEHVCACRDAEACSLDCCCSPRERAPIARTEEPGSEAAHERAFGTHAGPVEASAPDDAPTPWDDVLAPLRCRGSVDERASSVSSAPPGVIGEPNGELLAAFSCARLTGASVERLEAVAQETPSPPPRG